MAKNTIAYYTQAGKTKNTILNTAQATIFTAGANGSKILMISCLLAAAGNLSLIAFDGTNDHYLYTAIAPTLNLDLLDATNLPKAPNTMRYINLESGWSLKAVMSAGTSNVVVYGEDY